MKRPTARPIASIFVLIFFSTAALAVAPPTRASNSDATNPPSPSSAATDDESQPARRPGPRTRVVLRPVGEFAQKGVDERTIDGRQIADYRTKDGSGRFVLEDELGEYRIFESALIESVESAPEIAPDELRAKIGKRLLEEFGDGFQIKSTERFLIVYNSSEGYAEWCARLFENLETGFEKFAEKNGLELVDRVEPTIAVVFATRQDFDRYAARETPNPSQVVAYYNLQTNRVVLYDLSGIEGTRDEPERRRREYQEIKEILSRPNAAFNVATVVHEATHQIAFNRGVFLRSGPVPLWAVEGLSLLFETPNGRTSQGGWSYSTVFPKNERQLAAFQRFASTSTDENPLRDLIRQDKFMNDVQGSYASSWALFYYLYKKQPKELTRYLQEVGAKPPYLDYSPEERVADFEKFFGDDWERLHKNLARFTRGL